MPDLFFLIFGIIVSLLGLILLSVNISLLIKCNVRIEATISKIKKKSNFWRGKTITYHNPVVTYEVNGKKYNCDSPFSSNNPDKYIMGNKMIIFINQKDPSLCRFKGQFGTFIFGLFIFLIGLFFIILYII